MVIEKIVKGDVAILRIEGLVKLGESPTFFRSAMEAVREKNVVLDFSAIDYIDSTGIGELIGMCLGKKIRGKKIVVLGASERILRLLSAIKFPKTRIFEDEESALDFFKKKS